MDVCILAGGLGSRLAGVWSGPKCLAPIDGVPIIERLITKVIYEVKPKTIIISLGSQTQGLAVIDWWSKTTNLFVQDAVAPLPPRVHFAVEPAPLGRLSALISCLPAMTPPILVLNGDTLPRYDLSILGDKPGVAIAPNGQPAGAYIIDEIVARAIKNYYHSHQDLDTVISCFAKRSIQVPGYLDIGTPKGFAEAQQMGTAEG